VDTDQAQRRKGIEEGEPEDDPVLHGDDQSEYDDEAAAHRGASQDARAHRRSPFHE